MDLHTTRLRIPPLGRSRNVKGSAAGLRREWNLMKNLSLIFALSFLLLAASGTSARSQDHLADKGSIVLTIAARNDAVKAGDSVILNIAMQNMHDEPYCYHEIIETRQAELNGYSVEVTDSDARQLPVAKPRWPRGWSTGNRCIERGKSVSDEMIVNKFVNLSKPGTYHVRVSHRDKVTSEIIWSNIVAVTIAP